MRRLHVRRLALWRLVPDGRAARLGGVARGGVAPPLEAETSAAAEDGPGAEADFFFRFFFPSPFPISRKLRRDRNGWSVR